MKWFINTYYNINGFALCFQRLIMERDPREALIMHRVGGVYKVKRDKWTISWEGTNLIVEGKFSDWQKIVVGEDYDSEILLGL